MSCGCFLIVLFVNVTIGALTTRYAVEFWAGYFKGHEVVIPLFPCIIAGLFLGEITIPLAIITWLFSLCL